jgi:3-hydroxyethyl bacteriochlorophyllide a dehydrogenase
MAVRPVTLLPPTADDCVVDIEWSGISTGTERLLWDGRMPPFPGLGYPLVPGYESVGRVRCADGQGTLAAGTRVFVPGSSGFADVRGLFGGAARTLVAPAGRLVPLGESLAQEGVLLALAATAHHAVAAAGEGEWPDLVVGHGVLGRLVARTVLALGGPPPVVWERTETRASGSTGYPVVTPEEDTRRDYRNICDVSGDPGVLDTLIERLSRGGRIVLAGFYHQPLSFQFPAAFLREIEIRVAAEWQQPDLERAVALVTSGALSLQGLITHSSSALAAAPAYRTAFGDPGCLKMIIDWRSAP